MKPDIAIILADWQERNMEYARRLRAGRADAAEAFLGVGSTVTRQSEGWKYADSEARAQQERRQRGELNEDTGQPAGLSPLRCESRRFRQEFGLEDVESSLARHGFVGEEL